MHQIARAAGVGQGTLYRRYADKAELCADLLKETAEQVLLELDSWIAASEDKLSPVEVLDHVISRVFDFTDSRIHLMAACNTYMSNGKHYTQSEHTIYHKLHETVSCLIAKIVQDRNMPVMDVTLTADMLIAALNPKLLLFEREVRGYSKQQIMDAFRRIYICGLFGEDRSS